MVGMLIMICILILSLFKWAIYRLNLMAVLLYYEEKGIELSSYSIMQEYSLKAVRKTLEIKLD